MTEKINREAKERHAVAAYEARIVAFKFELYPGRDKPKDSLRRHAALIYLADSRAAS